MLQVIRLLGRYALRQKWRWIDRRRRSLDLKSGLIQTATSLNNYNSDDLIVEIDDSSKGYR